MEQEFDDIGTLEHEERNFQNIEDEPCISDDDGLSDAEADAMTLRDAGMGTDEDYFYFGGGEDDF